MAFPRGISLVTLGVTDLARSRAFYRALGWEESSASAESVAFFQVGRLAVGLFGHDDLAADAGIEPGAPPRFRGTALAINVPAPEGVAEALAAAEAAGARVLKPATEAEWGGVSGYFADPDGHLWEVAWNPGFPLNEDGSVTLPS